MFFWLLLLLLLLLLLSFLLLLLLFLGGSHKTDIDCVLHEQIRCGENQESWAAADALEEAGIWSLVITRFAGFQKPRDASMFLYTTNHHDIIYQNIQFSKYTVYQITHFKIYNLSSFIQVGRQAFMYIGNIFPVKQLEYCDPFKRSMLKTDMMIIGSWVFFLCWKIPWNPKGFFGVLHSRISFKICQIRS